MVANPYAVGTTVYGSGSSAATSGTVDPLGYIERELEKRRQAYQGGSDGQSDTRSGIAASALEKNPTSAPAAPAQALDNQAATSQFYSLIGASPDGTLQYPQLNLPFDLDIANQRADEVAQYNQSNQEAIQALQRAAQNRLLGTRQIDEAEPGLYRQNLNGFAGRGMAYSSGYGTTTADIGRELFNSRAGIESQWQQDQQDIANQGLNNRNNFLSVLNSLAGTQAERAAQKASELTLTPPTATPSSVPTGIQRTPPTVTQTTPTLSKAAYLKLHPTLASMSGADRARFLRNHPEIAKDWARYN